MSGITCPGAPKYSATLNFEHNWYLPNGLRLSPYVSVHYQSKMFFDVSNLDAGPYSFAQRQFATENAALRLINEKQHWAMELYVNNLTDELVRQWMDPGPDSMKATFFPPRTYGLKLRKEF